MTASTTASTAASTSAGMSTAATMTASRRRGACPGLAAPMPTGDGLLARLRPVAPMPPSALAGLAAAARSHGNGVIEVTARGSVQVRGLAPATVTPFAAAVAGLGIDVEEGVAVIAGFDAAAAALAGAVRGALAAARLALSPKLCVAVDGGGPLQLDAVSADVRLRPAAGGRLHVGVASDGRGTVAWAGTVAAADAAAAVVAIVTMIAARGPRARAAEAAAVAGVAALAAAAGLKPSPPPPLRPPADVVGMHALCDGTAALGVALGFGHCDAADLAVLARRAGGCGVTTVRPAPPRALLFTAPSAPGLRELTMAAHDLGFVTDAADPRRAIAACAGAPACAAALIPARRIAAELAPLLPAAASGVLVHVSGCPKGCAHPHPAPLTLTGHADGCAVVRGGIAAAMPHHIADPGCLGGEVAAVVTAADAARLTEDAHG